MKGRSFSWSPDGSKLAFISGGSKELLLAEVQNNKLETVNIIGSGSEYLNTEWSPSGKYLQYVAGSSVDSAYIHIYSLSDNSVNTIDLLDLQYYPVWCPSHDKLLYSTKINNNHILNLYNLDEKKKQTIISSKNEFRHVQFSKDGKWIFYTLNSKLEQEKGLWKVKSDGTGNDRLLAADDIEEIQWSNNGQKIAVAQKMKDNAYRLSIITADGKSHMQHTTDHQYSHFNWSEDDEYLYFTHDDDIWKLHVDSYSKTALTYKNVDDFCEFHNPEKLFFTIEYPNFLSNEEEDLYEWSYLIRGIHRENQLISIENMKNTKLLDNVASFTYCTQSGISAFYQSIQTGFLETTLIPVIRFTNGKLEYIPRTAEEHLALSDMFYMNDQITIAEQHLKSYWKIQLSKEDFNSMTDLIETVCNDSTISNSDLFSYFKEGAVWRTVILLEKLNSIPIELSFKQMQPSITELLEQPEKKDEELEEKLVWPIILTFGKYREFKTGIDVLTKIGTIAPQDSSLMVNLCLAQAILANELNDNKLISKKLNESLSYFPHDRKKSDMLDGLTLLPILKLEKYDSKLFHSILDRFIEKIEDHSELFDLLQMKADNYYKDNKYDKALQAYKQATTLQFDEHEIWDKIIELEQTNSK